MIEDTKVITGQPQYVEGKIQEYMNEHPDGEILSSSTGIAIEPPAKEGGKSKEITKITVILGRKL